MLLKKVPRPISKKEKEFQGKIDYAFKEFGFWIFKQHYLLIAFWYLELVSLIPKAAEYAHNKTGHWQNYSFNHITGGWFAQNETPSLQYIGLSMIFLGLSHPSLIHYYLSKMTFLDFDFSKSMMDAKCLMFCIFIFLISTRLTDLIQQLAFILSDMSGYNLLIP